MNQYAHKIIFNKRLGRMDVVSEIVSNQGKGSQTTGYSNGITTTQIKPLVFNLLKTIPACLIAGFDHHGCFDTINGTRR